MKKKYSATTVGACFSIVSALATFTIFVPLLIVMPLSLILEIVFKSVEADSKPIYITMALAVLFTFFTWLFCNVVVQRLKKKKDITIGLIMSFMILEGFIFHTLGFYLWSLANWENAGDGQFMFGMFRTFPYTSIIFVFLGLTIDLIRSHFAAKK